MLHDHPVSPPYSPPSPSPPSSSLLLEASPIERQEPTWSWTPSTPQEVGRRVLAKHRSQLRRISLSENSLPQLNLSNKFDEHKQMNQPGLSAHKLPPIEVSTSPLQSLPSSLGRRSMLPSPIIPPLGSAASFECVTNEYRRKSSRWNDWIFHTRRLLWTSASYVSSIEVGTVLKVTVKMYSTCTWVPTWGLHECGLCETYTFTYKPYDRIHTVYVL